MKKRVTGILLAAVMAAALMMTGCSVTDTIGSLLDKDTTEEETVTEEEEASEEVPDEVVEEEEEVAEEPEEEQEETAVNSDGIPDGATVISFGENQNAAVDMPTDTKLYGVINGGNAWFSFTTDNDANADYQRTLVNKTSTTYSVTAEVYDDYGTQIAYGTSYKDGLASTFSLEGLSANTTYYVCMTSDHGDEATFMLIVRNFNGSYSSIWTGSDALDADENTVVLATNQDDAGLIPVESKISATATGDCQYYAFMTDAAGEYSLTVVDETSTTYSVTAKIVDEYGTELAWGSAYKDGQASTFSLGELTADTIYYIQISTDHGDEADYTITVREPEVVEEDTAEIVPDEGTAAIIEEE